jgi:hypothetical protein
LEVALARGGRALRAVGSRVWAGEPVARGPDGEYVLSPFTGTVTRAGEAVTIRRRPS